jgi:O-acetyl-ADP-ribose deacetylase (regulator of RNase III)
MKANTIDQDILLVDKGVIAHFCNCLGYLGGLAGAITRKYPVVKDEYVKILKIYDKKNYNLLGQTQIVRIERSDLYVANLFTQYDIGTGRKTEYSAVKQAVDNLKKQVISSHRIYFPDGVGAGLGGGSREIIESIINETFTEYNGEVFFCKKL